MNGPRCIVPRLTIPTTPLSLRRLLRRMMPAQKDIFATLWPSFAGEDIKPRAVHRTSWCSAELMRLAAGRVDNAVGLRLLQQAERLAEEQDASSVAAADRNQSCRALPGA